MSNYTGSWNAAAIAPDTGAKPGAAPVLDLPADGEDADAASVAQALQTLGNHVAFLHRPTAIVSEIVPLRSYRSARGHRMLEVDHYGQFGGNAVVEVDHLLVPSWSLRNRTRSDPGLDPMYYGLGDHTDTFNASPVGGRLSGWSYLIEAALGGDSLFRIRPVPPAWTTEIGPVTPPQGRGILLAARNDVGNRAAITREASFAFHPKLVGSLEWSLAAIAWGVSPAKAKAFCGLCYLGGSGLTNFGISEGAYFRFDPAVSLNWQAVVHGPSGSTAVDTAVVGNTPDGMRFRVQAVGADADDSSTGRVLFLIDNVVVANITANLPTTNRAAYPFWGVEMVEATSVAHMAVCGPIVVASNTGLRT